MLNSRIAIFIDGENFRHSLGRLFPQKKWSYLPKADWESFLELIRSSTEEEIGGAPRLLRAYWYVIDELVFNREFDRTDFKAKPLGDRLTYFRTHAKATIGDVSPESPPKVQHQAADRCAKRLLENMRQMDGRLSRWKSIQSKIQRSTPRLQFQRFGYSRVELETMKFSEEKGVDVKLAIDMITLKDNYDIAVLVSGDADYIPALSAVKNAGKHVVVVDFLREDGAHLPGGAVRLKEHADFAISLSYSKMRGLFMDTAPDPGELDY